jgi:hypothetical protein
MWVAKWKRCEWSCDDSRERPISRAGSCARRTQASPNQVGLTVGTSRRRTPGRRREELATLASISINYVRLERGKETRPRPSVLDAIACALFPDWDYQIRSCVARLRAQSGIALDAPERRRPQEDPEGLPIHHDAMLLLDLTAPEPAAHPLIPRSWAASAAFLPDGTRSRTLRRNSGALLSL